MAGSPRLIIRARLCLPVCVADERQSDDRRRHYARGVLAVFRDPRRPSSTAPVAPCGRGCIAGGPCCPTNCGASLDPVAANQFTAHEVRHMSTEDDPLLRALTMLADVDRSRRAGPQVERALLDAFDRETHRGRSRWSGDRLQQFTAVAAIATPPIRVPPIMTVNN